MHTNLDLTDAPTVKMVLRILSLRAPALAGFIDDATGMLARGEVDEDFGAWVEVALERLDELAFGNLLLA